MIEYLLHHPLGELTCHRLPASFASSLLLAAYLKPLQLQYYLCLANSLETSDQSKSCRMQSSLSDGAKLRYLPLADLVAVSNQSNVALLDTRAKGIAQSIDLKDSEVVRPLCLRACQAFR